MEREGDSNGSNDLGNGGFKEGFLFVPESNWKRRVDWTIRIPSRRKNRMTDTCVPTEHRLRVNLCKNARVFRTGGHVGFDVSVKVFPPASRESLSRSSTPLGTAFLVSDHTCTAHGNTRRKASTMCARPFAKAHAALRTTYPHPTYPPCSAPPTTPSTVRAARHATPQEATLIISIFPIRSGGRGTSVQHSPPVSPAPSPSNPVPYHPHERSPSAPCSPLSVGGRPKEKYLYLSVSSRDTWPLCPPTAPGRLLTRAPFSSFPFPPPPWKVSRSPTPFSARWLALPLAHGLDTLHPSRGG